MMNILPELYINKSGTEIALSENVDLKGLHFLDLTVQSPQLTATYLTNAGLDGEIDVGEAIFGPRTVQANFYYEGTDIVDFELATHEIWKFFFQRDPYYIRSSLKPGIRYKVRPKPYDPTRLSVGSMTFTLEFDLPSGFGESLGTTLDMFTYESDLWQIGQNLAVDRDLQYVFNTSSFSVFNASDIKIDPVQHHLLQIAMTCSGTPTIANKTTGDSFSMTSVSKSDVLLIDGIYPYLNNVHCGRNTDHGIITLDPGWNEIEITGATNINISWLFRFLYY